MPQSVSRLNPITLGLMVGVFLPIPLLACSLCGGRDQKTLSEEWERARLVLYGRVTGSELFTHPGAVPGSGRTNFQISRVLKDDVLLVNKKEMILERWLPVPDAKDPP